MHGPSPSFPRLLHGERGLRTPHAWTISELSQITAWREGFASPACMDHLPAFPGLLVTAWKESRLQSSLSVRTLVVAFTVEVEERMPYAATND